MQLETLGSPNVYAYVVGKRDWLAVALPSEGRLTSVPTAGDVIGNDDIVCQLGERLGDVTDRVRAYGRDACIVVNNYHVVLGRLQGGALQGNPDAAVEDVMRLGPSTVRPDPPLETVAKTLRDSNTNSTLVPAQRAD